MSRRRTVFLACPYGQVGGGMGSIMAYLASMQQDPSGRFDLQRLESRGGGHIALSPLFLAWPWAGFSGRQPAAAWRLST